MPKHVVTEIGKYNVQTINEITIDANLIETVNRRICSRYCTRFFRLKESWVMKPLVYRILVPRVAPEDNFYIH